MSSQLWAEQGPSLQLVQVLFVWFLSSRDNSFYLARQLNCFHFFLFGNKSANPAGLEPRALLAASTQKSLKMA